MIYYFIKLIDNAISVYECSETEQHVLKNMGEESQNFDSESFWMWWKKKVEYQGEHCIFIIATDQDTFDVPEDIHISSDASIGDKQFSFFEDIAGNVNLITKPDNLAVDVTLATQVEKPIKKVPRNNQSLEDYFVKETVRLRS